MAGFRGPLLPLALSAVVTVQAGYRGPLPVPPVGGSSGPTQAGFRNPLPIPPLSGDTVVIAETPQRKGGGPRPPEEPERRDEFEDELILVLFAKTVIETVIDR